MKPSDTIRREDPSSLQTVIDRHGLENVLQHKGNAEFLTYYQRYMRNDTKKVLNAHFQSSPEPSALRALEQLSERDRRWFLENMGACQLTYGCSGGCDFCGFDAERGAKEHLPFAALRTLLTTYAEEISQAHPFFYYASDPLDYASTENGEARTYLHVLQLVRETLGYDPFTSTVAPKKADGLIEKILAEGFPVDRISVISDAHRAQLDRRGLLSLPQIDDVYDVNVYALGQFGDKNGKGRFFPVQKMEGIGCFNGSLMTPRGLHTIVQQPNFHTAAPQRQFVVPYVGEAECLPSAGDDVRDVLSRHVPILDQSFAVGGMKRTRPLHRNLHDRECFVIRHPDPKARERYWIITFAGNAVTDVEAGSIYGEPANLFSHDTTTIRGEELPLGAGYAFSHAKRAELAYECVPPCAENVEMLDAFIDMTLPEKSMEDVYRKLFTQPGLLGTYIRRFRERFPGQIVQYHPKFIER